ncbi:MAG: DsrE family protein [Candidatus Methanoperedens sp.]|nr:DsrE family protein [Candidatus Methanoperedens sp.]
MPSLLYVQTSGIDTPERLYSPFILAQTAKAGVKLMVCEQSTQLINLTRGDFVPAAEIVGAATLNDLVLEADGTMWF